MPCGAQLKLICDGCGMSPKPIHEFASQDFTPTYLIPQWPLDHFTLFVNLLRGWGSRKECVCVCKIYFNFTNLHPLISNPAVFLIQLVSFWDMDMVSMVRPTLCQLGFIHFYISYPHVPRVMFERVRLYFKIKWTYLTSFGSECRDSRLVVRDVCARRLESIAHLF